jgi:hypothetical protein
MSIFRSIMSKIFSHPAAAASAQPEVAPTTGAAAAPAAASAGGSAPSEVAPATRDASAAATGTSAPAQPVDVGAVLTEMASKNPQKLNWQQSIVDLMKLLDLDSSLGARKELAGELGYTGSTDDSAAMNIWLHKQVMQKLAENGGRVPDSLKG